MCILKNDSEGTAQVIFSDFCNVDAVIKDLTALNLLDTECRELRCLTYLPAVQTLAAVLSAARGIDTSRRRYPDFFARMGSKME